MAKGGALPAPISVASLPPPPDSVAGAPPGYLETLARGAAQGASLGFADELVGAGDAALDAVRKLSLKDVVADYIAHRNKYRAGDEAARRENPATFLASELAGGVAPVALTGGAAAPTLAGRAAGAAALGGAAGLGASKADLLAGDVAGAGRDTAIGAGTGAVLQGVGEKVIAPAAKWAGGKLGGYAAELAERATGATRAQADKFQEGAGRELLDRGIVRFGDTPGTIAKRASGEMGKSQEIINGALQDLDSRGVQVEPDTVLKLLQEKIDRLRGNPATANQARALETIRADVEASMGGGGGAGLQPVSLSKLEQWKRGFGNVNWMEPDAALARKETYRALMGQVEKSATEAEPALAETFKGAKDTWGLLAPVQEAAEKRATQLNQHPLGGFLDTTTAVGGYAAGGPGGAVMAPIARKVLAPRAASTGAVATDKAAKLLSAIGRNPRTRMYQSAITAAAERGEEALDATHFILSQRSPEYREATMRGADH